MKKTNIYPVFAVVFFLTILFSAISFAQSTSCVDLTKDLYIGLSDSNTRGEVTLLQIFLKAKGYSSSLNVTGFFDADTQSAVQNFQSKNGIVASGNPSTTGFGAVGASTRQKIKDISCGYTRTTSRGDSSFTSSSSNSSDSLTVGSTGVKVKKLQEFLISHGFANLIPAGATGYFGIQTRGAVAAFQSANRITPAFGFYGQITRAKVESMSGSSTTPTPCLHGEVFNTMTGVVCSSTIITTATSTATSTKPFIKTFPPQCNDSIDNDNDGKIDFPYDPGCVSLTDDNERDSTPPPPPPPPPSVPLLLVQNTYNNSLWNIAYGLGGQRSWLIHGDFGDQTTGTVDLNILQGLIEGTRGYEAVPTSFTGYAVLDIEEPYFKWLREPTGSDHFKYAQSEMLRALNFAKQLRPNAKWGYYDIPLFTIHFPGGSWADASDSARVTELATVFAPTDLISAVDFFAPSIYSAYPSALTPTYMVEKEKARNRESVRQSLSRSNGKPVFTYISDRFWNSNPVYNYMAMPYQEFMDKQFIGLDNGANGVILWGGDNYWYDLGYVYDPNRLPGYALISRNQIRSAWGKELIVGIDPHTYIDAFQEQTLRITAQKLFGTSYTPKWPLFDGETIGGGI